ncbi:MAG: 23S rRNA (cytidine(2498)-2'-O)-methyltransferase RlmM [Archangium gephyra]|uniref:23S rRNA (Cytidine(2498)-2'-O)-methyltransferase RlmM n=1 Tax=Archangium gephyra TaxID=48 RepID=A0A2W5TMI0_9BACT|nr:MAG: 23S rRNA (cytidine(2498)-2'-O)-methyltransferase RlmM [Archangium gephyra]
MKKGDQRNHKKRTTWHVSPEQKRPPPPKVEPPKRVKVPTLPQVTLVPEAGQWLWTCRAGFEAQLFEELAWGKKNPILLGTALVASEPYTGENPLPQPPAFARMGFLISDVVRTPADAAAALPDEPTRVQVWVPDTDAANARAGEAAAWEETIRAIRTEESLVDPETPWKAAEAGAWLGQVCLIAPGVGVVGRTRAREALSLSAGGRARMKRTGEAPSRAAMKLDEALDWYGVSPGKGDLCVDLGSAPGGWTRRLHERGARVWSVDPANLSPDVLKLPRVKHFKDSAFEFTPDEPVDFLFCDMAWRPLEVAQLLGKWARKGYAAQLVANIKLPMKDKLPTLVRVRHTLVESGWKQVRMKQLYHDRDEVTVTARRA